MPCKINLYVCNKLTILLSMQLYSFTIARLGDSLNPQIFYNKYLFKSSSKLESTGGL